MWVGRRVFSSNRIVCELFIIRTPEISYRSLFLVLFFLCLHHSTSFTEKKHMKKPRTAQSCWDGNSTQEEFLHLFTAAFDTRMIKFYTIILHLLYFLPLIHDRNTTVKYPLWICSIYNTSLLHHYAIWSSIPLANVAVKILFKVGKNN